LKCVPASCLIAHDEGMNVGKSIFSQLIDFLPDREFRRCVARYGGDRYTKKLSCWEQFLAMAFAQRAYRESLRDIEACLGAIGHKLYHMGFGSVVARSTIADANEDRDWRIFADFAQVLIRAAVNLYADDATGIKDERDLYALDSTTIDLCLALFSWARFRKHKGAVKMHTLLDQDVTFPKDNRIEIETTPLRAPVIEPARR
jgi:GGDEF domain-containing protein